MPNEPIYGQEAIGEMFRRELPWRRRCIAYPTDIEEGNWAVLEWRDPKGFTGCGFFEVIDGRIKNQRGYWDNLTFNKLYGI